MPDTQDHLPETEIELRPEEVRGRQDIYSSLTDLHDLELFTDGFRLQIEEKQEEEKRQETRRKELAFMEKDLLVQGPEEELVSQLFRKEEGLVLRQSNQEEKEGLSLWEISFLFLAIFTVTGLYLFFFTHRSRHEGQTSIKEKENGYYNSR